MNNVLCVFDAVPMLLQADGMLCETCGWGFWFDEVEEISGKLRDVLSDEQARDWLDSVATAKAAIS